LESLIRREAYSDGSEKVVSISPHVSYQPRRAAIRSLVEIGLKAKK
jgi:hypothetical protein